MTQLLVTDKYFIVQTHQNMYVKCLNDLKPAHQMPVFKKDNDSVFIECVKFSPSGAYLLVIYSDKTMKVWDNEMMLKREFTLQRRSLTACFDPRDEKTIYTGDKCGNLFRYHLDEEDKEIKKDQKKDKETDVDDEKKDPIIGHISMLLYATCTSKYIITCDRDERVRISDIQSPHIIKSFCLGHHEFVCSCLPLDNDKMLTSSGDGLLKCWSMSNGEEISSTAIIDAQTDHGGDDDERRLVPSLIAQSDEFLVAAAPGSRCLHIFEPGKDDTSPLLNHCKVSVEGEVMALAFNADDFLYVIAASSPDKYRLFLFDSLTSSLVELNDELSEFVASIPLQKQDLFDFSEFFKQKNCQNVRYQKFFDKVGKRCGAQNEQQKNAKKIKVDAN